MNPFGILVDLFPLAGMVVLLLSFLSPVIWKMNTSPAMQLRPYVAPDLYLPDIQCDADTGNLIAALLNSTVASADSSSQNTTASQLVGMQQLFAKGSSSEEGGGVIGDIADLVSSIKDANSGGKVASTVAPHGNFDNHPNATVRVWLGPLGSCSRDLDGRKWCTKPSYRHPTYNISSFVQPNAYIYPAIIQAQTLGRTTLAFTILAGISCILSFIGNIGKEFNIPSIFYNLVIMFSEFITLWVWLGNGSIEAAPGSTDPRQFNGISRLFQCNQTTGSVELVSGIQYYMLMGDHYALLWASWLLVYVLGTAGSIIRYFGSDSISKW